MEDWHTDVYADERERCYLEISSKDRDIVQGNLFSCHAGWFDILERLFCEIAAILKDGDVQQWELRQVKEKLGGLRVYWR